MIRRLVRDPVFLAAFAVFLAMIALAMAAPLVERASGHALEDIAVADASTPDGTPQPPGAEGYVLGADWFGRDVLVTTAYATRASLVLAITGTALAIALAVLAGFATSVAGRLGEVADQALTLVMMLPLLPVALVVFALAGSHGRIPVIVVVALFAFIPPARALRGRILSIRSSMFVDAAIVAGASWPRISRRHLLPHVLPVIAVLAGPLAASVVVLESTLSYLAAPPEFTPESSLGVLLASDGLAEWQLTPWVGLVPVAALLAIGGSLGIIADRLARAGGGSR